MTEKGSEQLVNKDDNDDDDDVDASEASQHQQLVQFIASSAKGEEECWLIGWTQWGSFGSKQQLQRSCFDLSSNSVGGGVTPPAVGGGILSGNRSSSTFYIGTPKSKDEEDRRRLLGKESESGCGSGSGSGSRSGSGSGSGRGSSSTISSGVCSRCFCNLTGSLLKNSTPELPVQVQTPRSPRSPSLSPFTSVATYKVTELRAESPPPASPTLSTEVVSCSDVSRKAELLRLPSDDSSHTLLYNLRSELTHKTTTTTTRTLIVSRPVELLLNERGEIISKRPPQAPRKSRSNSFGCMLDVKEDEDNLPIGERQGEAEGEPSSVLSSPLTPEAETGDLRFIDDSSNSQSESERNSLSHNNNSSIADNNNSSKQLNNNNSDNNNQQQQQQQQANLCESCRMLMERNRNNAEQSNVVILRRPQV